MSGRFFLFLISCVLALFVLAGCLQVAKGPVDAIAVWQHQADSWDIHYSLWDHTMKRWYVPEGGQEAPIKVDTGDDHDPDVSANAEAAVAVWSKDDAGKKNIHYSTWYDHSWTEPAALSSSDKDSDPTVAMDEDGNALAVWVHDQKELHYSFYDAATGTWSNISNIDAPLIDGGVSLPEVTYSEYWGTYFLVFTGVQNNTRFSYEALYWGGWQGPWWIDRDAIIDHAQPTDQRTGISADRNGGEVTYVWPTTNGQIAMYSYKYDYSANYKVSNYGTERMPDVSYDGTDTPNGAHAKAGNIFHQPDVTNPVGEKQVTILFSDDNRPSLTFIMDKTVGLAVWWNKEDGFGEIYSAYYENNIWSIPRSISFPFLNGIDRNPAVTPMQEINVRWEEDIPYCGDGMLDAGEECEAGIACADPNDACGMDCLCYEQYTPFCPNGALDAGEECEMGIPCPKANQICWFDCKCYDWPGKPPRGPEPGPTPTPSVPKERNCKSNTEDLETTGNNTFNPNTMVCADDCDEGYKCSSDCVCEYEAAPLEMIGCDANTKSWLENDTNNFKADQHMCVDDCPPAYECNMNTCICEVEEQPVITPRCGDGVITTAEHPGVGHEECDTGGGPPNYTRTPDTCGEGTVCIACKCVGDGGVVGCSANTQDVDRTDSNKYNPSMQCTPDCDEGYECVTSSCTCVKKKDECETDEDCPDGGVCRAGSCVPCSENEDCGPTGQCLAGECKPLCEDDTDCPNGRLCYDGYCETGECHTDGDCGDGEECLDRECVPTAGPVCGDGLLEGTEQCDGSDDPCLPGICSGDCTCIYPPELDCTTICEGAGYPEVLGEGIEGTLECDIFAQDVYSTMPPPECGINCGYSYYYEESNEAGFSSCCCGNLVPMPDVCEMCPCPPEGPCGCPDPAEICMG